MNKTNQFSAKTQYVTPSCKSTQLRTRSIVCQSPGFGETGRAGAKGRWIVEEEDY